MAILPLTNGDDAVDLFADEACDVVQLETLSAEHALEAVLSALIVVEPHVVELPKDVEHVIVAPDAARCIKQNLADGVERSTCGFLQMYDIQTVWLFLFREAKEKEYPCPYTLTPHLRWFCSGQVDLALSKGPI